MAQLVTSADVRFSLISDCGTQENRVRARAPDHFSGGPRRQGDHRNFRLGVPVPFGQSLEHQVGDHFAHAAIAILRHACDVGREDEIA